MNDNNYDKEYYLTMNHFSILDYNKKLSSHSSSESDANNNSSENTSGSENSENSENSEEPDTVSYSGSDNNIKNVDNAKEDSDENEEDEDNEDDEEDSEEESEEDAEDDNTEDNDSDAILPIDKDDLFNSKTNGNEFFGEVLNNKYLIIKKLGYGSFSSVWMAYDVSENKLVAIKIINPQDYKEGILEVKTYKKLDNLDNTYLLTMIDCFEMLPIHTKYQDKYYLKKYKKIKNHIVMVLPLMACSTFDLLKCEQYEDGLPLEICTKIMEQILLGIKELEKNNLMHTDLKPENVLVYGLNREADLLLKTIHDINIKELHKSHMNKLLKNKEKESISEDEKWLISYKLYKEITKIIINFLKNDMNTVKKQMKVCKVSSNYIKDIKIKICDFNLVLDLKDNLGNKDIQIQTRYYRAPEILIGSGLHNKSDYWSLGCILFELLTGDILFDPEKDSKKTRDIHHMYLIEELAGQVPKHMLNNASNYKKLYKDGFLINVGKKVKNWNLRDVLKENYNDVGLDETKIIKLMKIFNGVLNVNPDNRTNIKNLMKDLQSISK